MKVKELKEEFKQLSAESLEARIDELRRELLTLRLQAATAPVKSLYSKKHGLRYAIACGLTFLNQKRASLTSGNYDRAP